jgi:hypothetical protein
MELAWWRVSRSTHQRSDQRIADGLLNIRTLGDPVLLHFFGIQESAPPRPVSTSEVYGNLA